MSPDVGVTKAPQRKPLGPTLARALAEVANGPVERVLQQGFWRGAPASPAAIVSLVAAAEARRCRSLQP